MRLWFDRTEPEGFGIIVTVTACLAVAAAVALWGVP